MFSRVTLVLSIVVVGLISTLTYGHGIKPSTVEYRVYDRNVEINLSINAELFLSGIDASRFIDTSDAPEAELYDELRKLKADKLESKIRDSINKLKSLQDFEKPSITKRRQKQAAIYKQKIADMYSE